MPVTRVFSICAPAASARSSSMLIQVVARIDHQRLAQFERGLAGLRRGQHGLRDEALRRVVVDQERILAVGLVGQPAAARLLPGELLIHQDDVHPGRRQLLRRECTRRTSTQNGDSLHLVGSAAPGVCAAVLPFSPDTDGWPGGRLPAGAPPPCGSGVPVSIPPCGFEPAPAPASPGRFTTTHFFPCVSRV